MERKEKEPMHWADITAAIYKAGTTPKTIADDERVSPTTVSEVIRGTRTSKRIANAISAVTAISVNRMWPGQYS